MVTYLIRRIFHSIVFVFLASFILYTLLVMLMPGGPSARYLQAKELGYLKQTDYPGFNVSYFNEQYRLDKPWPLNYLLWLFDPSDTTITGYNNQNTLVTIPKGIDIRIGSLSLRGSGILTGDFGQDPYNGSMTAVSDIIAVRWGSSLSLLLMAFAVTLLLGIPLGIVGAVRKGSLLDHTLTVFSLGGISIPPYALSYFLIIFLALGLKSMHDRTGWDWLPWFPSGGYGSDDLWNRVYYMTLPAIALAIPQIARIARHTRFAMLDVLKQDYVRTAWAKGLGFRSVIFKHALRNSLISIITQVALFIPLYMSAGIAVENVFGYNGLGKAFYRAVGGCIVNFSLYTTDPPPCPAGFTTSLDYPLVLALLLLMVILVAISNLVADVIYLVVDPRISYEAMGKAG
jgi:peptide/nickel transport system permease protein